MSLKRSILSLFNSVLVAFVNLALMYCHIPFKLKIECMCVLFHYLVTHIMEINYKTEWLAIALTKTFMCVVFRAFKNLFRYTLLLTIIIGDNDSSCVADKADPG